MRAAKAWGQRPSELGICAPEDDLAYIVAWEKTETNMIAWEQQEHEREMKRKQRKRGRRGSA